MSFAINVNPGTEDERTCLQNCAQIPGLSGQRLSSGLKISRALCVLAPSAPSMERQAQSDGVNADLSNCETTLPPNSQSSPLAVTGAEANGPALQLAALNTSDANRAASVTTIQQFDIACETAHYVRQRMLQAGMAALTTPL